MIQTDIVVQALRILVSWPTPLFILLGFTIGFVGGALPGIGAAMTMAILLPLTAPLDGGTAVVFLVSIYASAAYGSSTSAILLNVPGMAASAATTFDGYAMTEKGLSKTALAISATSSGLGGLFIAITLFLISPFLITIVLRFTSPEYFLMAIFGLALITFVTKGAMVKGFVAGGLGLLYSTVGIAPAAPELRYTFGNMTLMDGLSFIAALIGLFAIAEMLVLSNKDQGIVSGIDDLEGSIIEGIKIVFRNPVTFFKSALIGGIVGSIPGAGSSSANFVAYAEAVRSQGPEGTMGEGDPRGVIAPEASNNSTVGGALIPTLSFGIPGGGATAVLLGGMIMHGLIPGPDMFTSQLFITYSLYLAIIIVSILILIFGLSLITRAHYITAINHHTIIPVIIVLSVIGGLSLRDNWFDLFFGVMLIGLLGYYMKKYDYSVIAFVLGAVLGPIAEENLIRSLQVSQGSYSAFVSSPESIFLVLCIFAVVLGPLLSEPTKRIAKRVGDQFV